MNHRSLPRGAPSLRRALAEYLRGHHDLPPPQGAQLQVRHYQRIARRALSDDPRFAWIMNNASPAEQTDLLLTELGRFQTEAQLREAAAWLCKVKPKPRVGLSVLKSWQGRHTAAPSTRALQDALSHFLEEYMSAHPACTLEHVSRALEKLFRSVQSRRHNLGPARERPAE